MLDPLEEALITVPLGRLMYDQINKHLADGERAEKALARVRALAAELDATKAHGGLADGYWEAARRIRAALEPPKEQTETERPTLT